MAKQTRASLPEGIPVARFVQVYQSASSDGEVAQILKLKEADVVAIARQMKKDGVRLKDFQPVQDNFVDIESLNQLIAELDAQIGTAQPGVRPEPVREDPRVLSEKRIKEIIKGVIERLHND